MANVEVDTEPTTALPASREPVFDDLARHCGNSTVRVILRDGSQAVREKVLGLFRQTECTWEFSTVDSRFALNISSWVDYGMLRPELGDLISSG